MLKAFGMQRFTFGEQRRGDDERIPVGKLVTGRQPDSSRMVSAVTGAASEVEEAEGEFVSFR